MRTCDIDGCEKPRKSRGWCQMHYMRWWNTGDLGPAAVGVRGQRIATGHSPRYAGDRVGYYGAHRRVRDTRGPATVHDCADCGAQARHWAYDHTDPAPLVGPGGLLYSADPDRYKPLCVKCHAAFDERELGRRSYREPRTHCRRGHELTPENTGFRSDNGGRRCLRCRTERWAERRDQINAHRREPRAASDRVVV